MRWYQRLRWKLLAIPFTVVIVGIVTVLFLSRYLFLQALADGLYSADLVLPLQSAALFAVLGASLLSMSAGTIVTFIVWKSLITPLRQLAESSQRIADGRTNERIPVTSQMGDAIQNLVINYNQMAEKLEQTERKRIQILGDVTHELRTPLTGLKGYIEGIEDGIFTADSETLTAMNHQIGRLHRLIDDIQQLSRLEAQTMELHLQPFDMHRLVQQTVAQLVPYATEQGIDILMHEPTELLWVMADSDRAAQILTNLISNSIRYGKKNGAVAIFYSDTPSYVHINLQDDGIGLTIQQLDLVFERFYRVEQSRTSVGSGVGLTISRHLARAMGGDVVALSTGLGQGSCFTLSLPKLGQTR